VYKATSGAINCHRSGLTWLLSIRSRTFHVFFSKTRKKERKNLIFHKWNLFCTIGDGGFTLRFTSCDHCVSRIACHDDYCCCCYRQGIRRLYFACAIGVSLPGPFPSIGAAGDVVLFPGMSGAVAPNAKGEEKVPDDPIPTWSGKNLIKLVYHYSHKCESAGETIINSWQDTRIKCWRNLLLDLSHEDSQETLKQVLCIPKLSIRTSYSLPIWNSANFHAKIQPGVKFR